MAFGFGFNKQKVLSAAEKFVQQGKLQNAIAEYDKVLKHDPKDLTVNNTIGDLYSRLGDSAKAIECFKMVGDAYAAQGFTVKGIAMYKKITKLQPSVDASLKLAELYTQQGLFNDARAQYLQVAEDFMKNGNLDQAVRLFQKVLEMDPENVPMRVKLAEVYVRLDKKKEAWEIFSAAAEALRARGSVAAAEDVLKRMLSLDPSNSYVLLLRGKAALEADDPKGAIGFLEKAADIDSHPDGLRDLLKAYLQIGPLTKAVPIAEKLLTVHNDAEGLFLLAEGCARMGEYRQAIDVYTRHADRLLATDSSKLLASLHTMITHVRDDSHALDAMLALLNKAGESTHVNEVIELLAHSCVKDGNLTRARELYKMLATTEPQNKLHMQNYQQVAGQMEGAALANGITAEEGAVIVEELEATAPVIDQSYPDHVSIALRSAITDADLFLSYNLPDKALVPLLAALPQAPQDVRLNQRLAALHTRFHRFTEAAVCFRTLESVYHDASYPDEAVRYGELAERYEQTAQAVAAAASAATEDANFVASFGASAGASSNDLNAAAASLPSPWPAAPSAAGGYEISDSAVPEFSVQELPAHELPVLGSPLLGSDEGHGLSHESSSELDSALAGLSADHVNDLAADLANEWEDSLSIDEPASIVEPVSALSHGAGDSGDSSNPEIAETIEEINFYLEHFMTDQARAGIEKLEALTSDNRILDPLRAAIETASHPHVEAEPEIAEINADELPELEAVADLDHVDVSDITEPSSVLSNYGHTVEEEISDEPPMKYAAEFTDTAAETTADSTGYEMPVEHAEPVHAAAVNLDSLVADLEASLGGSFPQPVAPVQPHASQSSQTHSAPSVKRPEPAAPKADEPQPHAAPYFEPAPVSQANAAYGTGSEIPETPSHHPAIAASAGSAATGVAPAMSYSAAPVRPLGAEAESTNAGSIDLSEMFGELRQELEEDAIAGDDDPETHYNLGVAFREMGLLDEAIAELQKVCTAIDRGKEFTQPVQTYTWLAQCFLDKGVPQAAIRWYEKALTIPGLDAEARLAINYELGSASEIAQDKAGALRYFTNVYGSNIDYRDVAERIQSLKS